MKSEFKKEIRKIFRTGNLYMRNAINSETRPLFSDGGKDLKKFKQWCANIGHEYPKIRLYFRCTYHSEFMTERQRVLRPRYKDSVTGELISIYESDLYIIDESDRIIRERNLQAT